MTESRQETGAELSPVGIVLLERLKSVRCAWITPALGMNGSLLYSGPLLRAFARTFAAFRVVTGRYFSARKVSRISIEALRQIQASLQPGYFARWRA